jgi:predicted PurR-regulated permease PerM
MSVKLEKHPEKYALLLISVAFFLAILFPFIQSILLGLLMAMILNGSKHRLARYFKIRSPMASFLCTLAFSLGVLVPIIILFIFVGRELLELIPQIQETLRNSQFFSAEWWLPLREKMRVAHLEEKLLEGVSAILSRLGTWLTLLAASIPKFVMELFIFTLTLYYALENSSYLGDMVRRLTPLPDREFQDFHMATRGIFKGVILGSLLSAFSQGTLILLGYWLLGIPQPFLFGVLTAFLSIIPVLGTIPTGLGGCVFLILQGRYGAAAVMFAIFAFAGFSDNIIKPWVLKDAVELHPLLGLLGALGGLALFGFIGLFLGPLLVALGTISLKILASKGNVLLATGGKQP